jgi:hypothetical protein
MDAEVAERAFDQTTKMVLLLGNYEDQNSERFLKNIGKEVGRHGYSALTIKEIQTLFKSRSRTPRQLLHYWLSNVAFVIADDTMPSGVIVELEHALHCGAVVAIISRAHKLECGCRRSTWMTIDYDIHSPNFKVFPYEWDVNNNEKLGETAVDIVNFAETRIQETIKDLQKANELYEKQKINYNEKQNLGNHM